MQTMTPRRAIPTFFFALMISASASSQPTINEPTEKEPHRYGGWYCPDNFGFVPVDIQKLDEVPAITDRLPTQQELKDKMSLIDVDTSKYPDARALEMDLPRVARIYSHRADIDELIIVIQAIIVEGDTVVGYRFPNGGNGSAWLSQVTFLSDDEMAEVGSQPFFYSKSVLKASKEDIWKAITYSDYGQQLAEKFDQGKFFASEWTSDSRAYLDRIADGERAAGFVGTIYGNAYLHIDYDRDGFHYSEKLLMVENHEDNTTELFFASGPYPDDLQKQKSKWDKWLKAIKKASEAG